MSDASSPVAGAVWNELERIASGAGAVAMLSALADRLRAARRWHALFDLRLVEARLALGLPAFGDPAAVRPADRARLDAASLEACREVGWPLLAEGHAAAAWMYLRAAASADDVACRLRDRVAALADADPDDEEATRELQEIVGVALWEGVDPALGVEVVLRTQGTCNAVTAFDQAIARQPASRQRAAAATLVAHLHATVAAAGGFAGDSAVHVDVSHLQAVLRIGRVCTDRDTLEKAWELAEYGCRLPADLRYPGDPPFEDVAAASRLFYGAQLGRFVAEAEAHFRAAAARDDAGTPARDMLVLLLWRLGRPAEALAAALDWSGDESPHTPDHVPGMLPSLVEMAAASGAWDRLLEACRARGDEITFAAALATRAHQTPGQNFQPQPPSGVQSPQAAG